MMCQMPTILDQLLSIGMGFYIFCFWTYFSMNIIHLLAALEWLAFMCQMH